MGVVRQDRRDVAAAADDLPFHLFSPLRLFGEYPLHPRERVSDLLQGFAIAVSVTMVQSSSAYSQNCFQIGNAASNDWNRH